MFSPYIFLKKKVISFIGNIVEGANSFNFGAIVGGPALRRLHLIKLGILQPIEKGPW